MSDNKDKLLKSDFYGKAVQRITRALEPYLHRRTDQFVQDAQETYAKDDPRYAKIIEFEVKRRGYGAGMTQDVAEPLFWTGIKTIGAIGVAAITESVKNKDIRTGGRFAMLGILLNNTVDLLRLIPRYEAGLQGSLEMARDRQRSIEATGIDPFDRSGNTPVTPPAPLTEPDATKTDWQMMHPRKEPQEFVQPANRHPLNTLSADIPQEHYR